MIKDRVKYYGRDDWAYGHNMQKIEKIAIPKIEDIDINDAIEYYEIKKYFDDDITSPQWSFDDKKRYKEKSIKLFSLSMKYFNSLTDDNILDAYNIVDILYRESFWELFNKCKLYKQISDNAFKVIIESENCHPFLFLPYKDIVNKYDCTIGEYLINSVYGTGVIIHFYEQEFSNIEKINLPKSITGEKIVTCIDNYIKSEHPNPNDLMSIFMMQESKNFPIDDSIRLSAKRRYDEEIKKLSVNGIWYKYGLEISFDDNLDAVCKCSKEGNILKYKYNLQYLQDTLENPDILNNFIYVFEFVDFQMRCLAVSSKHGGSIFERLTMKATLKDYIADTVFNLKNGTANLQIKTYYEFLKSKNIRLENVIEWFFTKYLQEEFQVPEMKISLPNENSTYYEKCCLIIPTIDSIIKQFSSFVKDGKIDFELVGMSTKPIKFENIPSLINGKYVCDGNEECNNLTYLLFSNQCLLSFNNKTLNEGKEYESFTDLITHENIKYDDYENFQKNTLDTLISKGIIEISKNGFIVIRDTKTVAILNQIYNFEVINKYDFHSMFHDKIDELVNNGILREYSSLLSIPEINYFNYLLNRSEYRNGLEIRNRYIHGNQQVLANENIDKENYMILLRIIIILIIKINDEFCILDKQKQNKKKV